MPFFPYASRFTNQDCHMYDVAGNAYFNFNFIRSAVRDETSDGRMIRVHTRDIDLQSEIARGSDYYTYSAFYGGCVVAVKVFKGPGAEQTWKHNIAITKCFFHPNVTKMIGVSAENTKNPHIVYGLSDKKMSLLLAKVLRTDLNKSVQLSMKTVKGLAAGLSYIKSLNLSSKGIVNILKLENIDMFANGSDEPVLSIHLPDTTAHGHRPASSFYHLKDHRSGIEILSGLCQKLFSEVTSILYEDYPERELDIDHSVENYSSVVQTNREGHSNVAGDVLSETEVRTPHKTPRREVRWKLDKSANNRSLESIARHFEDYLNCVSASSADSLLRRIAASPHKWVSHRCPGYLREEITLTPDVSRSVVIAHRYPSQSEICTICGQLVALVSPPLAKRVDRDYKRFSSMTGGAVSQTAKRKRGRKSRPPTEFSGSAFEKPILDSKNLSIPEPPVVMSLPYLGLVRNVSVGNRILRVTNPDRNSMILIPEITTPQAKVALASEKPMSDSKKLSVPEPPDVMSLPYLGLVRNVPVGNRIPLRVTNPDQNSMMSIPETIAPQAKVALASEKPISGSKKLSIPEPPDVMSLPYLGLVRNVPVGNRIPLRVTNPDWNSMMSIPETTTPQANVALASEKPISNSKKLSIPKPPDVMSLPYLGLVRNVPVGNRIPLRVTNPD